MHPSSSLGLTLAAFLLILTTIFLRLLYILPAVKRGPSNPRKRPSKGGPPIHVLIVLGSGGHTAEMLSMLSNPYFPPQDWTHRTYVISEGDAFSAGKAVEFEEELDAICGASMKGKEHSYSIHTIPRARRIHQSLVTTPYTSLQCLLSSIFLLRSHPKGKPDLIFTNGPATALLVVVASLVLSYFSFLDSWGRGKARTRSIYVESWARVKTPSLSCRIIVTLGLCDRFLVQWKQLEDAGWGEYRGVLVK